jgi:23S rRNA pseudouridine1911/1915/1917 synthase
MKTRTIVVSRTEVGRPVASLLKHHLHISWSQARRLVEEHRVRQGPSLCRDPQIRVRAGQKLRVQLDDSKSTQPEKQRSGPALPAGPRSVICYVDDQIVVVNKPAGLTTMRHPHEAAEFGARGRRFLPPTLADVLPGLLAGKGGGRVIAVHRLDRDTSGLVILARTPHAARHLGGQFRAHTTDRTYLAIVRGRAKNERIESWLVPDRGDGRRGSTTGASQGQRAVTHVRVAEDLGRFTLVECRLETGRTHQVRIHLGERGTPICGERIYDRQIHGAPLPDASGAERLALHAASLTVEHPTTGKRMHWQAGLPLDMRRLLQKLRRQKTKR